ncbi:hypothetical protein C8Q75DRAFT_715315 [Abortiporus biennis]|nr:hypothetical protein C8Q75DRAFT_715315 [Abortiporus biennis]
MGEQHKLEICQPPLSVDLYNLHPEEIEFFKKATGIEEDEELKRHVLEVQCQAYDIFPYTCIRRFAFATLKISLYPAYEDLLRLGKERPGALFLELGCCFGTDARKAIYDGFPMNQVIASDLRPQFWDLGHKLFNDTPQTFPVPFLQGDVFDPKFLSTKLDSSSTNTSLGWSPGSNISSLKALNQLTSRLSAIHTSLFFHLFTESQQYSLAQSLFNLLSPEAGSMIFGAHGGKKEKGFKGAGKGDRKREHGPMFCHSVESWKEMWYDVVSASNITNGNMNVEVKAELRETWWAEPGQDGPGNKMDVLVWSVKRL